MAPVALALSIGSATAQKRDSPDVRAAKIIALAHKFVGAKYQFGGSSPTQGFDCSGLVQYVYGKNGIALPRSSKELYNAGKPVRFSELAPGDLVFKSNTYKSGISHVAIYIGDGNILHATNSTTGILIEPMEPWGPGHPGARRVIPGLVAKKLRPTPTPASSNTF
jgi:cell wall-associated NlpC family hydrolase